MWLFKRKLNQIKFKKNWSKNIYIASSELNSFITDLDLQSIYDNHEIIKTLSKLYQEHYFDLLGSGWSKIEDQKRKILKDDNYKSIDWHCDINSRYRWDSKIWYTKIKDLINHGRDIKVPWELSRMQHLTIFCWAYHLAEKNYEGFKSKDFYLEEFKRQVLDFISSNPPYYGINWTCAMEVGIRATNLLICYDIFKFLGANFDKKFKRVFFDNIVEHGHYIENNLENPPDFRGNHYLANIAGLTFIASYLPENKVTKKWLNYSYTELQKEFSNQFNEDGTNFEGSTNYHCLSLEFVIYTTAIFLNKKNNGKYSFNEEYFNKMFKAIKFIEDIAKENREIPLIGDNDSGKFIKLLPFYEKHNSKDLKKRFINLKNYSPIQNKYLLENTLIKDDVITAGLGLFKTDNLKSNNYFSIYKSIIQNLSSFNQKVPKINVNNEHIITTKVQISKYLNLYREIENDKKQKYEFFLPENWQDELKLLFYKDFGLYLYKSKKIFLLIKCGYSLKKTKGGHAHNDQLSIELIISRKDVILDPGSYVYTSNNTLRNKYRSVQAHFTPQIESKLIEQEKVGEKLFEMKFRSKPKCLYFNEDGWVGVHSGFKFKTYRVICFRENKLEIYDFFENSPYKMKKLDTSTQIPFSPFYGWCYEGN